MPLALLTTAAFLGFIHTLLGPDHYIPFIVMARAKKWSTATTAVITAVCGIGHIGSSVLLGFIGVATGTALNRLVKIESLRGEIAGWCLILFGLLYAVWGLRRARAGRAHHHWHSHADGTAHAHDHRHVAEHVHLPEGEPQSLTPWVLFTIFVFGPCEPLIPMLLYPAAQHNPGLVWLVAGIFGMTTIATMLGVVLAGRAGLSLLPSHAAERYAHVFAGAAIFMCGVAVQFLGL